MALFRGRPDDVHWGSTDYSVTRTQKKTLDGLEFLFQDFPRELGMPKLWKAGFYSQHPKTGAVVIGFGHRSVTVDRNGRIVSNRPST